MCVAVLMKLVLKVSLKAGVYEIVSACHQVVNRQRKSMCVCMCGQHIIVQLQPSQHLQNLVVGCPETPLLPLLHVLEPSVPRHDHHRLQ